MINCSCGILLWRLTTQSKRLIVQHQSVMVAECDARVLSKTFSFSQKSFASVAGRLDGLNDVPRRTISTVIVDEWNTSTRVVSLSNDERNEERTTWKPSNSVPSSSEWSVRRSSLIIKASP